MPDPSKRENGIKSVVKTLRLLKLFSPHQPVWSAEEMVSSLGYHKSSVQRILATLEKEGFLSKVAPRRSEYRLGPDILFLGNVAEASLDLRSVARPAMADLVQRAQETCYLCVADQGQCLYIEKVECSHPIRIVHQVGQRNPLYCTGVGKALMSGMADEEIDRLMKTQELKAHTRRTITDPHVLKRELEAIRKRGLALDNEELNLGVKCVAAPIRNRSSAVVAAISLSGPAQRFTKTAIRCFEKHLKQASMEISQALGFVPAANPSPGAAARLRRYARARPNPEELAQRPCKIPSVSI
ncbi:MAG: IclR family transcriptional regulator, partial [Deltaproteobacteria bacterium]